MMFTIYSLYSLYIHGGRDIKVGPIATMWRIHLGALNDLALHGDQGVQWEPVTQKGTVPGNISHHKAAVFGHKAVIFGGI